MTNAAMTALGFIVIFVATAAGAALVFFFRREISPKLNTLFLGFASGVMTAASVWSLLIPSIEGAGDYGDWKFVPAVVGFLVGGAFLVIIDKLVPHLHKGTNEEEGLRSHLQKPAKLFLAVTIHNIPEGLPWDLHSERRRQAEKTERSSPRWGLRSEWRYRIFPKGRRSHCL